MTLAGCVSSEETGGISRSHAPQQTIASVDTSRGMTRRVPAADSLRIVHPDSVRTSAAVRTAPRFRTRQDTVRAALVRTQKPAPRIVAPIERPANAKYTVQIGAFARAANALRAQKHARSRFPGTPTYDVYIPAAKVYRVSVGRFEERSAASTFRRRIIAAYPLEYAQCWINYVAR